VGGVLLTSAAVVVLAMVGCTRADPPARSTTAAPAPLRSDATSPVVDARADGPVDAADHDAGSWDAAHAEASASLARVDAARVAPSIRRIPFTDGRSAFVVMPRDPSSPVRLMAMLHGVCTPPSYVCGEWARAAADVGMLVCPTGNATCGPEGTGAPSWEGPLTTWDDDLELSIAVARKNVAPRVTREGAVLAGFSRGAYAAVIFAVRHPGRWPYLVLNEADVELTLPMLRGAGVRRVALIAGEWGNQLAGERHTAQALEREGYPIRLWVMPAVGHAYSPDIDAIMGDALAYVLADERPGKPSIP